MDIRDDLYNNKKITLGLVHLKGKSGLAETPITQENIREIYDSKNIMCCMPYVVVGYLLGVKVY